MWYRERFFKYTTGAILILVIIFLLGQLDFFFGPIRKFMEVLFFPVLISGFLYYLLRPVIGFAEKIHLSRTIAILIAFLLILIIAALLSVYGGSLLSKQCNQFLDELPKIIDTVRLKAQGVLQGKNLGIILTGKIGEQITTALQKVLPFLMAHIIVVLTALTGMASVLFLVPFILYYFLKDDARFAERLTHRIPPSFQNEFRATMKETDKTLSAYIIGQAVLAVILGILLYIGYLIIGVRYSLILALFALIISFIPIFGSIIGVIPAALIGFAQNPWVAVKIVILAILVHFLDGHLIAPRLIGKRLKIHPLTIIFLFLVSAALSGIVGILIAIPVYATLKIIVKNGIKAYQIRKNGI